MVGETGGDRPVVPRALMAAVIGMGVLIVIGTITLAAVIVSRISHGHRPGGHEGAARFVAAGGDAALVSGGSGPVMTRVPLPPGGRIVGVVVRGDGTVLARVRAPDAERLLIWDPPLGRIVAELDLAPDGGSSPDSAPAVPGGNEGR